jgi:hypothetical protein
LQKKKSIEVATRPVSMGEDGEMVEEIDPVLPALQSGFGALAQQQDASTTQIMDGLGQLAQIMSAPSELVRGSDGRVAGSKKVFN